jgi:hypothetical protein
MITNIYKMSDPEFSVWLENFNTVAEAKKDTLGLATPQITEMDDIKSELNVALNEKQAAEDVKKAKTVILRAKRKAAMKKVAYYNIIFKANDLITDDIIEELGFDASDAIPALLSPQQPIELTVQGFSTGINSLKWKKNGNKQNTVYIIDSRKETAAAFSFAGTTTKAKFDHKDQKPGERTFYRVRAMRNDEESSNSNEAVIY